MPFTASCMLTPDASADAVHRVLYADPRRLCRCRSPTFAAFAGKLCRSSGGTNHGSSCVL